MNRRDFHHRNPDRLGLVASYNRAAGCITGMNMFTVFERGSFSTESIKPGHPRVRSFSFRFQRRDI